MAQETPKLKITTIADLKRRSPVRDPRVFEGLFEICDVVNLVASSKLGKTYFQFQQAICFIAGLIWLGFQVGTAPRKVLIVDNELKEYHIWNRLYLIADKLGVDRELVDENIHVVSLRDNPKTLTQVIEGLGHIKPDTYGIITLDAMYKFYTDDLDENKNSDVGRFYKQLSAWSGRTRALIQCVHHTTKGNQSEKAVGDVGAGAGAMLRAADSHVILRQHQETDCFVMEALLRSERTPKPVVLRRQWPLFVVDRSLDPSKLRTNTQKPRPEFDQVFDILSDEEFAPEMRMDHKELRARLIIASGCSRDGANEAMKQWEEDGKLYRVSGKNKQYSLSLITPRENSK